MHYILDGHDVVPVDDILVWAEFFGNHAVRRVARTQVNGADVSTVFLGMDHRFGGGGPPLVFESMVFGGPLSDEMRRYSTWDEAEAGHAELVERCRAATAQTADK